MERRGDRSMVMTRVLHDHACLARQGFELPDKIGQILVGVRYLKGGEDNLAKGPHYRDHTLSL